MFLICWNRDCAHINIILLQNISLNVWAFWVFCVLNLVFNYSKCMHIRNQKALLWLTKGEVFKSQRSGDYNHFNLTLPGLIPDDDVSGDSWASLCCPCLITSSRHRMTKGNPQVTDTKALIKSGMAWSVSPLDPDRMNPITDNQDISCVIQTLSKLSNVPL